VELKILGGHAHNAPYLNVPEDYWEAILEFIRQGSAVEPGGHPIRLE
jgi:hypothetical protein